MAAIGGLKNQANRAELAAYLSIPPSPDRRTPMTTTCSACGDLLRTAEGGGTEHDTVPGPGSPCAPAPSPVIVTLTCEATPSTETQEIDRSEWEALTPGQRLELLEDMAVAHMNNAGGSGWGIDDPADDAMVGGPEPDELERLREFAAAVDAILTSPDVSDVHRLARIILAHSRLRGTR